MKSPDSLATLAYDALGGRLFRGHLDQRTIPALAKDAGAIRKLRAAAIDLQTTHAIFRGDSRSLCHVADSSVHLVVTSPPYWTLKRYRESEGQLGHVERYEVFLAELDKVWSECFRVLVPGGRLIIVVGDVCLSRKRHGRHMVVPLHASIQEHCRTIGFDNLAPIIWHKIANARFEVQGKGGFLGKPYEPNAVIKNDIEFILMQRKGGAYRTPTLGMRLLSIVSHAEHQAWFRQVWTLTGASTKEHPAPFPVALAERLIRMFSFVGDTVLDPFLGTGTTSVAAAACGRNSIGFEIDPSYSRLANCRARRDCRPLAPHALISYVDLAVHSRSARPAPTGLGAAALPELGRSVLPISRRIGESVGGS